MQISENTTLLKSKKSITIPEIIEDDIINSESVYNQNQLKIFDEKLNENSDYNPAHKLNSNFNKFILKNTKEEYIFDNIIRNLDYPKINKNNSVYTIVKNSNEVNFILV